MSITDGDDPNRLAIPTTAQTLGRLIRLTRKELREILRDRRTILTLILMPVLLYPLLSLAFRQFFLSNMIAEARTEYKIGFESEEDGKFVLNYLAAIDPPKPPEDPADDAAPQPDSRRPKARFLVGADLEKEVRDGNMDLGIRVRAPESPDLTGRRNLAADLELLHVEGSVFAREAFDYFEHKLALANAEFLKKRLRRLNSTQRPVPVEVKLVSMDSPSQKPAVSLAALVPLILILMTITGAVYPAIDLTAGERERGTLEILVAAPIPRVGLLGAKYVAVLTVAMLTALVNLSMMGLTLWTSPLGSLLMGPNGLSLNVVAAVLGLLFLFAGFFSAVLLAVTSFARSFKEAQAYLIPLMLASIAPGLVSMVPGLRLSGALSVTPLINIVLLARDLLDGKATWMLSAIVVISTMLYALAAIAVAARIFGAEAVLYSDTASIGEVFRRPRRLQRQATVATSLFCLALMFPSNFLLGDTFAHLQLSTPAKLMLAPVLTALIFGGFPLGACILRHVSPVSAFRLRRPAALALLGSALLGLSLWPFAHALLTFMQTHGLTLIPEQLAEKLKDVIAEWRQLPPWVIVAAYALVPAVFEELAFRGFLFSALARQMTPRKTILLTAILFGLFHITLGNLISVDRLPTSIALGLVLGWVAWRSGSVVPGMLLHACHNAVLLLLGYYEEDLTGLGWLAGAKESLPAFWFAWAGLGSLAGFALIYLAGSHSSGTPPAETQAGVPTNPGESTPESRNSATS